jgi:peptidoglycan hydrolase-like protein with peptidoglycan-binding domain
MTETPRLIVLIEVALCLGACSNEQMPPRKSQTIYPADAPIVREVQIALRNRGYYADAVDGYVGESTAIGIQRFQVDHCQRVRPVIDRTLLVSLGIANYY